MQQKLARLWIDPPCPKGKGSELQVAQHWSFPCLVGLGNFGYNRSVVTAFWRYAHIIHSRERWTSGKGYTGQFVSARTRYTTLDSLSGIGDLDATLRATVSGSEEADGADRMEDTLSSNIEEPSREPVLGK